jgi:hypothetical protein
MLHALTQIYTRDLDKLKAEINLYPSESSMWHVIDGTTNSGGNLCLHLIGNINTFIGKDLGDTAYVRDRPLEFSAKDVPRKELLAKIDATIAVVSTTLDGLADKDLTIDFPYIVFENKTSIEFMLIHLCAHLSYHLGQINYHRRMVAGI